MTHNCPVRAFELISFQSLPKHYILAYGYDFGPAHTDDMDYLAQTHAAEDYQSHWTEEDEAVRQRMCQIWSDFAKTGNPTPEKVNLVNLV